ncbi:MAG: nuclear transport factor 2 family protein [Microvirga sp.]|nr:nuclear transport factor 2 family protein [Microvirga sp.]
MYHFIVDRKVRGVFEALNRGDYEVALAGMAPRFEHVFSGSGPIGGVRRTKPAMRKWFERLFRLNRNLDFEVKHVAVSGWPWDTTVTVEWSDSAVLANAEPYLNNGVHVVRMRWGKVVSLHAYLDTAVFDEACRRMAEDGIAEAAAPPIED